MHRFQINLNDKQYEWLRNASFRRKISMAEIVRENLCNIISAKEAKAVSRLISDKPKI